MRGARQLRAARRPDAYPYISERVRGGQRGPDQDDQR
jgi:hypothetical protein